VDALMLDGLLQLNDNDFSKAIVPKLVAGLLGRRKNGHWTNTQDNAFALVAMNRYFRIYEKDYPQFESAVWLGGGYAGTQIFEGREITQCDVLIPMSEVMKVTDKDKQMTEVEPGNAIEKKLVMTKSGRGRMYYRIALRYAPKDVRVDGADRGFGIVRRYSHVDNPAEVVTSDKDGIVYIKAGCRVKVEVVVTAPGSRNHIAVVDNLPAGLETQAPSLDKSQADRWTLSWWDHRNFRDSRVEAFAKRVYAGTYALSFTATATSPGSYVAPPAKVEEMYTPETFGNTPSQRVVVLP